MYIYRVDLILSFSQMVTHLPNTIYLKNKRLKSCQGTFSVKGQTVRIFGFGNPVLSDGTTLAQQRPQGRCKWKGVAVFHSNLIYKDRWSISFGLWAVVCWTLVCFIALVCLSRQEPGPHCVKYRSFVVCFDIYGG